MARPPKIKNAILSYSTAIPPGTLANKLKLDHDIEASIAYIQKVRTENPQTSRQIRSIAMREAWVRRRAAQSTTTTTGKDDTESRLVTAAATIGFERSRELLDSLRAFRRDG